MIKILIIFFAGAGMGALCAWFLTRRNSGTVRMPKGGRTTDESSGEPLIARQAREKEENKQRILGILETQSPLTNNHIEQLLGISDATATRYLDELEREGRVRQVGKTGRYVYYEKV